MRALDAAGLVIALALAPLSAAAQAGPAAAERATLRAAAEPEPNEPAETPSQTDPIRPADPESGDGGDVEVLWSVTGLLQYRWIPPSQRDQGVGRFFDQYEFTPNKGSDAPFELGIRDAAVDVLGRDDTPIFQMRFDSPTSNLGVSGSQIDEPFFNQRLDAVTRLEGFDVDLRYRRMRTEQLRLFPNTAGAGLLFDDRTNADDRFYRDRTGFLAELRLRPHEAFDTSEAVARLGSELSLRGGYQGRDGKAQLRFHRDPSGQWFGLPQDLDANVGDVGGGLLLAPDGLLTATLDFDYQRFRFESDPILESELGFAPPDGLRTINFIPSSDRLTGQLRFNSRIGDRAVAEAGFQIGHLEQVGGLTPAQMAAGLDHNSVRTYAANAAVDVRLVGDLSLNAYFDYARRNNDIERGTALFNDENGTQIDPFVRYWQQFGGGVELELRLRGSNRVALGVSYENVTRDLRFSQLVGGPRILPVNSHIRRDSQLVSIFGRAALRPWRGLRLNALLGVRLAPSTAYIVELDNHVYGELRAAYTFAWRRPLVLTSFVRGGTGDNDDFTLVSGQGPEPPGPSLQRSFDRSQVTWGLTANLSPVDRLHTFASFYWSQDHQKTGLDLSSLQRYFQETGPFFFGNGGLSNFQNRQLNAIVGARYQLTEPTDLRLRYGFTHAEASYAGDGAPGPIGIVADSSIIDSDTHAIDFEIGHWVRDGLRVLAGYRLQLHDDRAPLPESIASAIPPFDLSTRQHTVTLGVTLTSDLVRR